MARIVNVALNYAIKDPVERMKNWVEGVNYVSKMCAEEDKLKAKQELDKAKTLLIGAGYAVSEPQ